MVAFSNIEVCPVKLLRKLQSYDTNSTEDSFVFGDFNSRYIANHLDKTFSMTSALKSDQHMRCLGACLQRPRIAGSE